MKRIKIASLLFGSVLLAKLFGGKLLEFMAVSIVVNRVDVSIENMFLVGGLLLLLHYLYDKGGR